MDRKEMEVFKTGFRAMGTDISVDIVSEKEKGFEAEEAFQEIKKIFEKNEKIFSRFNPDSELSEINRNIGKEVAISPEMFELLELCLKFYDISDGYFDPRIIGNLEKAGYDKDFRSHDFNERAEREIILEKIGGDLKKDLTLKNGKRTVLIKKRIDTTGIAKGYTVDQAADHLKKMGFRNFIVEAGGDMRAAGKNQDSEVWKVGVEGIEDERLMLNLENESVATSGISRKRWQIGEKKFHHLIDPKDPEKFSFDIKTVTVIGKETVEADGWAKILLLMGREKGLEFANQNGLRALFLDYKGNAYLSRNMKQNLIS